VPAVPLSVAAEVAVEVDDLATVPPHVPLDVDVTGPVLLCVGLALPADLDPHTGHVPHVARALAHAPPCTSGVGVHHLPEKGNGIIIKFGPIKQTKENELNMKIGDVVDENVS